MGVPGGDRAAGHQPIERTAAQGDAGFLQAIFAGLQPFGFCETFLTRVCIFWWAFFDGLFGKVGGAYPTLFLTLEL